MQAVRLLRSGQFGCILQKLPQNQLAQIPTRTSSAVADQVKRWDDANNRYFGPERDTKNFPHPVMRVRGSPVRLGFIPEEWFTAMYPKTGVTGPYVLGTGLLATLLSKEIWVVDHGFADVLGFTGAFLFCVLKLGPGINKMLHDKQQRIYDATYTQPIAAAKEGYAGTIENAKTAIWSLEGQKHLFEAKKENVDLQLEAIYRQRLQKAFSDVKNCLDYHVNVQNTKRRFEQEHMVNWIVSSVVKSITPQQEKESLKKCIADLKALSAQ